MLDLAILGLLREEPRHGYELRRALGELGFRQVSFGSLYPALRRLERRGAIAARPGTGRRRAYQITPAGIEELHRLLLAADPHESDRAFHMRIAFLGSVGREQRLAILAARRHGLTDRLRAVRASFRGVPGRDRYRRSLAQRRVRATEADIAWLDELIAAERRGAGV